MALQIRGRVNGLVLQSNSEVTLDFDGVMRGKAVFEGDSRYFNQSPKLGDVHPKDTRLICIAPNVTYLAADKIRCSPDYMGIATDPTPGILDHPGGINQDPIETHPKFITQIAGTPGNPRNNAIFDETTGEFLGFGNGRYAGTRSYLVPTVSANITYWTRRVPNQQLNGKKYAGSILGFNPPPNCSDKLLLGQPYKQYGGTNGTPAIYQVTAQILCAPSWDGIIYG